MSMIKKYSGGSWQESYYRKYHAGLTSVGLPVYLAASGNTLDNSDVEIAGNTVQDGTPTPDNPIMPEFVGERTGNLFDKSKAAQGKEWNFSGEFVPAASNIWYATDFIAVDSSERYIRSSNGVAVGDVFFEFDESKEFIRSAQSGTGNSIQPSSSCKYITFNINSVNNPLDSYMLTQGSTAKPYEPYGYKIPITCGEQTVPVYLGQTQTVRRIKNLVLTGEENWDLQSINSYGIANFRLQDVLANIDGDRSALCSHFYQSTAVISDSTEPCFHISITSPTIYIRIQSTTASNATEFRTWLAQQCAAGIPVTVWYVIATPATGIVNEPLAKIGNYADELHISDAGVTIPVSAGDTKLDIDTYLPPSSVKISNFWSTHSDVKVYQNNAWQISSWDGFRDLVRAGTAETAYPVGTILYTTWGDTTSEAVQILAYDVADYMNPMLTEMGYTHNVVLCDLKADTRRVFDTPEAWLYVETELPAGVYRFTIPNYDTTYGGNKTYIFTSTATVPVGGQITLNWAYQQNPASVAGYSAPASGTALFTASISVWDGTTASTDLGTIKLAMTDPESTYGKLNHIQRARYGSNNYYQSGIRQWLNSDKAANTWWEPTTIFDRAYSNRNTNGKLYSLSKDFVRSLAKSTVKCVTNQVFESGSIGNTLFSIPDKPYIVRDRVFMLTHTEVNLSAAPNVGSVLTFYSGAGNSARIKYNNNGGAEHWWLRTPDPAHAGNERPVNSSGALSSNLASVTYIVGVAAYTIQ